jgi:hypothetical protein
MLYDYYKQFAEKLKQGPSQGTQVALWLDSLLTDLKQAKTVAVGLVGAVATDMQSKYRHLSAIDRHIFLQFLEAEIRFLLGHRVLKILAVYNKLERDRQIAEKRQIEIKAALIELSQVQGIDRASTSALTAQGFQTFQGFLAMKVQEQDYSWAMHLSIHGLDDILDNRETKAVRKILEQLLEYYLDIEPADFNAADAWRDLKKKWGALVGTHHQRIAAVKKLYEASGGGRDVRPSSAAFQTIDGYYKGLYEQIELAGPMANISSILSGILSGISDDPWS